MDASWKKNYIRYKTVLLGSLDRYQRKADIKVYVEIILSLVTISVFSIFALRPTIVTIAQLIKDIEAKKEVLESMDSKLATLAQAQIVYDQQQENIKILHSAIPFSPSPNVFIRQVEGVSSGTVAVSNMSISEAVILGSAAAPTVSEHVTALPENVIATEVDVSSSTQINNYSSLYEFFKSIENLRTPVLIDSVSITLDESDENQELIAVFIGGRLASLKRID